MKPWYMQKTLWAGVGLIVTGVGMILQDPSGRIAEGIAMILAGVATISGRAAIASVESKLSEK
jgi:hypothetical protein